MLSVKLALKDLRGAASRMKILVFSLVLGVAALAAIGSIRGTLERAITEQGTSLLGGDAEISFSYRKAGPDELNWINRNAKQLGLVIDFRSLSVAGDQSALSQVKAVDAAYPLIGGLKLDPPMPLDVALASNGPIKGAVMEAGLAARLGIKIGDRFKLGKQEFTYNATIAYMPDQLGSFTIAPTVLLRLADLDNSGLLAEGTVFTSRYRMVFEDGHDLEELKIDAETAMENSGMRWKDRRNAAPRVSLFIDRLGNFLILVGLSGLFVGGVGIFASVQSFVAGKTRTIAILRAMGASSTQIFVTFLVQIFLLGIIGTFLGLLIGAITSPVLIVLLQSQFPMVLNPSIAWSALSYAAGFGMVSVFLFALWPIAGALEVKPTALLRGANDLGGAKRSKRIIAFIAFLLGFLYLLAVFSTGAALLSFWAFVALITAQILLFFAAFGLQKLLRKLSARKPYSGPLGWALAAITARPSEARAIMLSVGLGLSVLAAIGQIDGNLQRAVAVELPKKAPAFFLVDIQPDQRAPLFDRLDRDFGARDIDTAPMLRGIITQINDTKAEDWPVEHWVLRGDRGVSFAAAPPEGTQITKGQWWPTDYAGSPQVSFAQAEADELGVDIGDQITLNILGRPITAEITSLREVDFSTAGIGFVMILSPEPVVNAPHSSIATVYAPPEKESAILQMLARDFPTITAIGVRDAIARAGEIMTSIAMAIRYGAAGALATGVLVLIGTAAAGQPARVFEAGVLRALGASRGAILASFALRAIILGAGAAMVALICGAAGAFGVMYFVMDSPYYLILSNAGLIIFTGVAASLCATVYFALASFMLPPAQVLRHKE